jgi:hypothetical protein
MKFYLALFGLLAAGQSYASVPEAVMGALLDVGADSITVSTAVLVVIVGIIAFKFIRRALS